MMKTLIFDWGDTIMRDFFLDGPMWKWEKVELLPHAKEVLGQLSKSFQLIIATSADHSDTKDMIKALRRVEVEHYFQDFYSQKEIGFKKPDPRFFQAILEKQKLSPAECIMIGNSYEKDIEGAKAANIKTIFFNEKKLPGDFVKADQEISNLGNLKEAIEKLI